ncbi:MAG: NAD(+) diphosphatase [Bacteroides sp.]|nr:NAD(+) diphosphatase [Bacteroides sp.]
MEKVIIYRDSELLLVKDADGSYRLPYADQVPAELKAEESANFRFPGAEDSATYLAVPLPTHYASESDEPLPKNHAPEDIGLERVGLRESWGLLPEADYRAAAKGAELLNWSSSTRFCSVCGAPMVRATEISKRCSNPECGREVFPSLWPAIVVLVIKESPDGDHTKDEALLVHARNLRRPKVQTLVAGFVETGESLEECVAREVKEETSLEITDIRYEGSQSWPFPHQLMFGFTAKYRGGEIRFADGEISFGGFFRRDSLPELPTMPSLSRRIIDRWANSEIG